MIHDITPPITPELAVWPGDTPASREVLLDMARGHNLTLSTLHATVHLGAHADAPNHYGFPAPAIHERPLAPYLGRCQVIRVRVPRGGRVSVAMLGEPIQAERVLLATGTYPDPQRWNPDFAGIEPELIDFLNERSVRLIGIDTPSVDLSDSQELPAHQRLLACDMAVLEGLVLERVPAGVYELIALPLPLVGFDASPVRAILRDLRGAPDVGGPV
ncbi:MAG: cyclase family protein [Phycisphaerales bacterium]|nr:cyclase family protein [Phycisphaerales bacterium]